MNKPNWNDIYQDIYGLLDEVQKRPAMFGCSYKSKKSFNALIAFIQGISFAEIEEGNPSFWDFIYWITGRVDGMSKNLPWRWMDEVWGNELAFDRFFELLNEYRACKLVNLCKANSEKYEPTFYTQIDDRIVKPELPLELYIGQFQPSEVYCLVEIYAEEQKLYFPYQNSIGEVKKSASSRWKVLDDEWLMLDS